MSLKIFEAKQIQAWDEYTIASEPISSIDLMERAATMATKQILASVFFEKVTIFCGTGNNGGDGLVIARLLHLRGISVTVYLVEINTSLSPDCATNLKRLPKEIVVHRLNEKNNSFNYCDDVVIDAIFGSGLSREISGWISDLIQAINTRAKELIAVDIASGLFCLDNSGNTLLNCIKPTLTVSFQSPKMPFFYAEYENYVGKFSIVDIGLAPDFQQTPYAEYILKQDIKIKNRSVFSHKGNNGYLLIIAGFENYAGAALFSTGAALRTGCGYVGVHCAEKNREIVLNAVPEALYCSSLIDEFPQKTNAIVIGPGLGKSNQSLDLLKIVFQKNIPILIDADAINLISENKNLLTQLPKGSILTPHQGELERLIGKFEKPEKRLHEQQLFSKKYGVFIVQKGAYSKTTCPDGTIYVNSTGNSGMATAGTGDVLSGIIGSFLAQGYSHQDAVINGVYIHGLAGDFVRRNHGIRGMVASDLIGYLREALNSL